jgi:hypothetical protein
MGMIAWPQEDVKESGSQRISPFLLDAAGSFQVNFIRLLFLTFMVFS